VTSASRAVGHSTASTPAADHHARELSTTRSLSKEDRRGDRGEDGDRSVDHPGERRVDPLLPDREQQQRSAHPHHAEEGDPRQVGALDGPASLRQHGERHGAHGHASPRDQSRTEVIEADLDQQERGAPDRRRGGEQSPLVGPERLVSRPGGGLDQRAPALLRSLSHGVPYASTLAHPVA
jgi:hypothetical protein